MVAPSRARFAFLLSRDLHHLGEACKYLPADSLQQAEKEALVLYTHTWLHAECSFSDAAIEAADVVLMDDDPSKIAKAISISRKCLNIVYENTVFAISVKFICLILGALGIANMWYAIFADVGVTVLAVLNAIRALFVKKL